MYAASEAALFTFEIVVLFAHAVFVGESLPLTEVGMESGITAVGVQAPLLYTSAFPLAGVPLEMLEPCSCVALLDPALGPINVQVPFVDPGDVGTHAK